MNDTHLNFQQSASSDLAVFFLSMHERERKVKTYRSLLGTQEHVLKALNTFNHNY